MEPVRSRVLTCSLRLEHIKTLEKIQKRSLKCCRNNSPLKWDTLTDRRTRIRLCAMFKTYRALFFSLAFFIDAYSILRNIFPYGYREIDVRKASFSKYCRPFAYVASRFPPSASARSTVKSSG
ncbi:hypothetical protein ANN_16971 [Periplaneta americana]|uniref:Uncharacterized protein n=1 Tax=Periplaneta americana TaxID=6978 RepID=A0ABQ8SRL0_PERAM|nr:hypothetical protein ANN_16971 [Periplaneta americana]